jgi:hypothetical protein
MRLISPECRRLRAVTEADRRLQEIAAADARSGTEEDRLHASKDQGGVDQCSLSTRDGPRQTSQEPTQALSPLAIARAGTDWCERI